MTDFDDLQETQKGYDLIYWKEKDKWKDLRHVLLHLNKLTGKIANVVEPYEHNDYQSTKELEDNCIPDLLIYAMHLARMWDINLEKKYKKRLSSNIKSREKLFD